VKEYRVSKDYKGLTDHKVYKVLMELVLLVFKVYKVFKAQMESVLPVLKAHKVT
jgi:hypothetical protein